MQKIFNIPSSCQSQRTGKPYRLQALAYTHTRQQRSFSAALLAQELKIDLTLAEEALTELGQHNLLMMSQLDTPEGPLNIYQLRPGANMIPFLYFAAELMRSQGQYTLVFPAPGGGQPCAPVDYRGSRRKGKPASIRQIRNGLSAAKGSGGGYPWDVKDSGFTAGCKALAVRGLKCAAAGSFTCVNRENMMRSLWNIRVKRNIRLLVKTRLVATVVKIKSGENERHRMN